jgi:outer membrane murein-binding lipoprotein Lpp
MKKYFVPFVLLALAAGALALGLPGGGTKIDTAKIDAALTACSDLAGKFDAAKAKVDACQTTLDGIATAHNVEGLLGNLTAAAALKDQLTAEEKSKLQTDVAALATLPADVQAIIAGVPDATTKIMDALTDVANQLTQNPLKAGDLNKKKDELNAGKDTLTKIATDAPALIESCTKLTDTIGAML